MIRLYVAGKYNDTDVLKVLDNMRLGIDTCTELMELGFAPWCPWLDYHYRLRSGNVTMEQYKASGLAWVEGSQAMLMLPNYRNSGGALAEKALAEQIGIPVFENIQSLLQWAKQYEAPK